MPLPWTSSKPTMSPRTSSFPYSCLTPSPASSPEPHLGLRCSTLSQVPTATLKYSCSFLHAAACSAIPSYLHLCHYCPLVFCFCLQYFCSCYWVINLFFYGSGLCHIGKSFLLQCSQGTHPCFLLVYTEYNFVIRYCYSVIDSTNICLMYNIFNLSYIEVFFFSSLFQVFNNSHFTV